MLCSFRLLTILLGFHFLVTATCAAAEAPAPKEPPSTAEINRLIEQLGSSKFAEREAAAKALEAIGPPAVEALRKAAAQRKDLEIRRRVAQLLDKIENSLDQLVIDYQAFGLPLPSEAKLVRFQTAGGWTNGKRDPISYSIGFLLRPGLRNRGHAILVGTWQPNPRWVGNLEVLDPEKASPQAICGWVKAVTSSRTLGLAIQCKVRGWDRLAQVLFCQSRNESSEEPPRSMLRELAWDYWKEQLKKPASDWTVIARRLKGLIASDKRLDNEENRSLLNSLDSALVPRKAKPGSIEAMIDDLIQVGEYYALQEGSDLGPQQVKLLQLGFDAVPHLIEHLEDSRLTRGTVSVGWLAGDLLRGLAGSDPSGDPLRKADALAWWNETKKVGEEKYLLARVMRPPGSGPNIAMLTVIEKKYPQHLPKLYRAALEDLPLMETCPLAKALGRSSLPRATKVELFLLGTKSDCLEYRIVALSGLREAAPDNFRKALVENLERLPKTAIPFASDCPEANLAMLVLREEDASLWELLKKMAKCSDVSLRMEILRRVGEDERIPRRRERVLDFLEAFLDDSDRLKSPLRDIADRTEIRNFTALQIADILDIEADPDKQQTAEDWAKLRAEVREALRRESAKSKAERSKDSTPKRGQ